MKQQVYSLLLIFALVVECRGETEYDCFRVVPYSSDISHLECTLSGFDGVDFAVQRYNGTGISVVVHHSRGWGYVAAIQPTGLVGYLNFSENLYTVNYPDTDEAYCAFTWNDPHLIGGANDYVGWLHIRMSDGVVTLEDCAMETVAGHRVEIRSLSPEDEPPANLFRWRDPETGINWYCVTNDSTCALGGGTKSSPAVNVLDVREEMEIPAEIAGLPVTGIVANAFYNCQALRRLTVPASVVTIAGNAFSGTSLRRVTFLGDAPKVVGSGLFGPSPDGDVIVKVGTKGWSNFCYWHGLVLQVEDDCKTGSPVYTNEVLRTDASWLVDEIRDDYKYSSWAAQGKNGWVRSDLNLFNREVYRIERLRPEPDEYLLSSNEYTSVDYWDLERVRRVSRESYWKVNADSVDGEVFEDVFQQEYDEHGNLTSETHTLVKNGDEILRETVSGEYRYRSFEPFLVSRVIRCKTEGGVSDWSETRECFDENGVPTDVRKQLRIRSVGQEEACFGLVTPSQSIVVTVKSGGGEEEALRSVDFFYQVIPPGPTPCRVSADSYAAYFRPKAVQVGDEEWEVSLEVDTGAIDLFGSVASVATQLGDLASGSVDSITVRTKPGLWYGIEWANTPVGPYKRGEMVFATGDTVELKAPYAAPSLFIRVVVSAKE